MIRVYCLILLWWPLMATGQLEEGPPFHHYLQDSTEHYVYGDTVFVRAAPSFDAKVLDTLYAGDLLMLLNSTEQDLLLKGLLAPWVNIAYSKKGEWRKGVMWSGNLGFTPMRRGYTRFVFGVDRMITKTVKDDDGEREVAYYVIGLKAVQRGKVIATNRFPVRHDASTVYIAGEIKAAPGLDGVMYVVYLIFGGEACGIPTHTYPLAWTGQRLISMPKLTNISDADVFYHRETFRFPGEKGGLARIVILEAQTENNTGQLNMKGDPMFATKKESELWLWDGKRFVFLRRL